MTAWRTVFLALADDAIAAILLIGTLAWLTAEGVLALPVAVAVGAAGTAILAIIAYKTAVALALKPKVDPSMVGRRGIAVTEISPDGMVLIEGEMWKAWSQAPIEKGSAVIVDKSEGLRLTVATDKNG